MSSPDQITDLTPHMRTFFKITIYWQYHDNTGYTLHGVYNFRPLDNLDSQSRLMGNHSNVMCQNKNFLGFGTARSKIYL